MKECRQCGNRNPDGAKTCQNCGSSDLEYVKTSDNTKSSLYMPQVPYQLSYQVYDEHKERFYSKLGGFLAFMAYGSLISGIITILEGLVLLFSFFKIANMVDGFGNAGAVIRLLGLFGLAFFVLLGVVLLILSKKIIEKDYDFLRYIQIVYTIEFLISLIIIFVDKSIASNNYFYESHSTSYVFYLIFGTICFIVGNIYIISSERVFYYMGGEKYIKRSLYTSGVTRWDALQMSKEMMEDPSLAEKYKEQMANTQMYAAPAQTAVPVQTAAPVQTAVPVQAAVPVQTVASAQTASVAQPTSVQPAPAAQSSTTKSSGLSIEDMEALKKLKELLDMGAISEEEYNNLRSKYISKETVTADTNSPQTLQAMEAGILGAARTSTEKKLSWKCNNCSTINTPDSKSCSYCGGVKLIVGYTEVSDEEAAANAAMVKFCGRCGSQLEPGARFCVECGSKVTY